MMKPKKYPSTPHLPFSPSVQNDDIVLGNDYSHFIKVPIVITEKMDGGNCQFFQGNVYARTVKKEATHPSFSVAKAMSQSLKYMVPNHIAIYTENMQGIHSIEYDKLDAYIYMFSALDHQTNKFLSWNDLKTLEEESDIPIVPVLFEGQFDSALELKQWMLKRMKESSEKGKEIEGFVIRHTCEFSYEDFEKHIAKFVRPNHIQTSKDWVKTWKQAKVLKN